MSLQFSKYILQFSKNTENEQTHLSFKNGKYNIPDNYADVFYKRYYQEMINMEKRNDLYLIEKVYNSNFAYFLDLEIPKNDLDIDQLSDDNIKELINETKNVLNSLFLNPDTNCIVSKRENNYHVNFYNIIVNSAIAKTITNEILKKENIRKCIDTSVYRTGLRLLGSKKLEKGEKAENVNKDNCKTYKIYDLYTGEYTELENTTFDSFLQTTVRRKQNIELTKLKESEKTKNLIKSNESNNDTIKGINNDKIDLELNHLLKNLKIENECLQNFDTSIQKIYAKQNKMGMFCYYVSINGKYCPFKMREHQRESSPIYFEINPSKIYIRCRDSECLRRHFPESGIMLPESFSKDYPNTFLSMTTKYWHSEINITQDIKEHLEASLSGSHYQIAKAIFHIYKNRFRVDDIKNTEWYEFEGVRWKKSHLMNIIISEELPKYYRSIKISDTSMQSKNLQDFLVNTEKLDSNMRNGMVDNIITKLENVSFKNNIISQLVYLFKTYDPDFYINLDSIPNLLGFRNGVYNFDKGEFREGLQSDCITFSTGYDYTEYNPNLPQVQDIYAFLKQIIPNRKVLEYTLKVLGKSLVGAPDERFYIWTGLSGANGKSTLVNFLENTLGDYITSVDVSLLTNKRAGSGNASPDVVRLRGKRIFTFQEPEHDDRLRTGILKQYTGGDTIIARELFKAPITFKLQGTMIMCCNDLPAVTSCDGGTWRRIRVVEFKSRFCDNPVKQNEFKIDPTIKYKIKSWRPYFMSILIHWYNKFLEEGMNEPEEVTKATAKYKVDNDKFNEFFDQSLEEHTSLFESNKVIYSHFSSWWSNNYPNSRIPEIKDLRRAMKIKFGNEKEQIIDGCMNYGFNVKIKYNNKGEIIDESEIEEEDL
jgi:P4 family phage/plasmid primase-like protien